MDISIDGPRTWRHDLGRRGTPSAREVPLGDEMSPATREPTPGDATRSGGLT